MVECAKNTESKTYALKKLLIPLSIFDYLHAYTPKVVYDHRQRIIWYICSPFLNKLMIYFAFKYRVFIQEHTYTATASPG